MRFPLIALCITASLTGMTVGCSRKAEQRTVDRNRAVTTQDIVGYCQATAELVVSKVNKQAGPEMENVVMSGPIQKTNSWELEGVMVTRQNGTAQTRDDYHCVFTGTTLATANASVSLVKRTQP